MTARTLATAPIAAYRRFVSPALPARCRYHPTCSSYAAQAIREFGILRGLVLAGWRLLRCNPLSHGGLDPIEAQTLFVGPRHRRRTDPVAARERIQERVA